MAQDVKKMMAQLKELRRKSKDEKYPADVREQFDMEANKLEMDILKENKVPGFSYGGAAKKKAAPKGMHRMPDGTMMKDSEHKMMAGGYAKKKMMGGGYAAKKPMMAMNKGGMANCGASMKPSGPSRNK